MALINTIKSFFLSNNRIKQKSDTSIAQTKMAASNKGSEISTWPVENETFYVHLENQYYQYFVGVNSLHELSLNPFEHEAIKSLEDTIKLENSLAKYIPRLPSIVPKLLHLLKTDSFDWKDIADLIASDPVILVEIIKIANSSAYNLKTKDKQLKDTLAKIGLLEVRIAIMKAALKPIMLFECDYFLKHSGTKIWDLSVYTATACRKLAEVYEYDQFDAYLAGLVSNMGMVIAVKKMNVIENFTTAPSSLQFKELLLTHAKQLSITIAQNWEMHSDILKALQEQIYSDVTKIKSTLGVILYEGTAVSMEYILTNKHYLQSNEQADNKLIMIPYEKAYKELVLLNNI